MKLFDTIEAVKFPEENIIEAKYPVFPGFFSQSVGIMQN